MERAHHHFSVFFFTRNKRRTMCLKSVCLAYLEYAGSIGCPPRIQEVIFARAHEPFTYRRKHTEPSTDKASREVRYRGAWEEAPLFVKNGKKLFLYNERSRRFVLLPQVCVCVCTYHSRRTWGRERSSRAGAAGTCQVWRRAGLPRYCSPFPQPATRLSDSSPGRRSGRRRGGGEEETRGWERRSVNDHQQPVNTLTPISLSMCDFLPARWSRVAGAGVPPGGPSSGQCCPALPSTVWCRRWRCRCSSPRLCGPGTACREETHKSLTSLIFAQVLFFAWKS